MNFLDNKEKKELSIDSYFNKLENPDNSFSFQLEKIETIFKEASKENIQNITTQINEIFKNDNWVKTRWDFTKTLQNLDFKNI